MEKLRQMLFENYKVVLHPSFSWREILSFGTSWALVLLEVLALQQVRQPLGSYSTISVMLMMFVKPTPYLQPCRNTTFKQNDRHANVVVRDFLTGIFLICLLPVLISHTTSQGLMLHSLYYPRTQRLMWAGSRLFICMPVDLSPFSPSAGSRVTSPNISVMWWEADASVHQILGDSKTAPVLK